MKERTLTILGHLMGPAWIDLSQGKFRRVQSSATHYENFLNDDIFRMDVPEGVQLVGFADDLALLVVPRT